MRIVSDAFVRDAAQRYDVKIVVLTKRGTCNERLEERVRELEPKGKHDAHLFRERP